MNSKEEKLSKLKRSSESRSKRVQLLITPQLHDRLKEISSETGASVNEIINTAIEVYIEEL